MSVAELAPLRQPTRVVANFRENQHNTLWVSMTQARSGEVQNFSPDLLDDLGVLLTAIRDGGVMWPSAGVPQPVHYFVLKSAHPVYFSLGGDLAHFRECIRYGNRRGLRDYSMQCADMVCEWAEQSNRTTTISLVQGRALGGGFETALAADYLIAEEQSELGFPEILFGLFPCTGGMSLLSRRVGVWQAERMLRNGKIYPAAELLQMGIVDEICPQGQGMLAVEKFIAEHHKHAPARLALQRARARLAPLNRDELHRVVDDWVEIAMALGESELRVMDMLIQMQRAGARA
ncbi:MAG: enoyl-CoA hydratase/isomerase family protein [Xanthomonadaceae bacterium]|nr:enoyl-CoA hydratase/isomerase family protein [Xanthomonadaceae bacterium]MDE1886276.1 enoyl-CoA hydratase/isomerase family protein [Xanthomonadaceae bacterium]MDE2084647.1 enoyl-CoA hydratase/isomerase family protein [Xanthomonadaceae bacterium]MDE2257555.1 enoyl-CoA hydratase/isomerase family protein [Xanthomonadaceae bacterium]